MSRMTSVGFEAYTLTAPFVPAGTIAAFATTAPCHEFNVETNGWLSPVGQRLRYPRNPCGTTVTFNECAAAVAGIAQSLFGMGKLLVSPPVMLGPPNTPTGLRVSATRHGVTG